MGPQQQLLEAIHATGTPMVVVLINSKPVAIPWMARHARAIVEAFNPGMLGGTTLAEILMGDVKASGKLTISFPAHVGQQPVWYYRVPGTHGNSYADGLSYEVLFPFGFGLSYTPYRYENLRVKREQLRAGETLEVSVEITNTGARDGVEIAQVYVRDVYTSVTWPDKLLKAYARVALKAGEKRTVSFSVPYEDLAIVNRQNERVVEPGDFEVMVGGSSRDSDVLRAAFAVVV